MFDKMAENSDENPGACLLPLARIKTIMKSSPEISAISQESLTLIAKATELFVRDLSLKTHKRSKDPNNIDYKDLSEIVNNRETLMFLTDIIPKKVTVSSLPRRITGLPNEKEGDNKHQVQN